MDSLAGYGSEEEYENDNSLNIQSGPQYQHDQGGGDRDVQHHLRKDEPPRYDDGTNYDDVTMDMSEDSSANESDEEEDDKLQEEASKSGGSSDSNTYSAHRRDSEGGYRGRERDDYRDIRQSPPLSTPVRRGLLGDRPGDPNINLSAWNSHSSGGTHTANSNNEDTSNSLQKPVPLMDVRPFSDQHHLTQASHNENSNNRPDRDSADRREKEYEKDKDNDRDRKQRDSDKDRDRHGDRDKDKHSDKDRDRDRHNDKEKDRYGSDRDRKHYRRRSRSRSRDRDRGSRRRSHSRERDRDRRSHYRGDSRKSSDSPERRSRRSHSGSPATGDYRSSYKVSKKLHAMEKMGLQIKTPDGTMATPQMLMQRSLEDKMEKVRNATGIELPKYYNPAIMNPMKYAEQMQKKKMLWGNKSKDSPEMSGTSSSAIVETVAGKPNLVNKWQGAKFAQDNDGKMASKFLRLMGVKDPNVASTGVQQAPGEIVKKQEEMFEAMQAQYDVARATTHTMRGVGLGFGNTHRHF